MNPLYTLLVMSGGSLVGRNIVAALSGRRDGLRLVATNSVADEPTLCDYDDVWLVPAIGEEDAFAERFEKVIQTVKPDLIVPTRDEDIAWLANHKTLNADSNCQLLCGEHRLARAMLDKLESASLASEFGLPFAATLKCVGAEQLQRFAADLGLPLIAKPRRGFASQGVRLIVRLEQMESLIGRDDYVLQEYVGDGSAILAHLAREKGEGVALFHSYEETKTSLQVNIAPNGSVRTVVATRNKMVGGKSVSVTQEPLSDSMELAWRCGEAFAGAGWRGPLNVQCQRARDSTLKIFEFNGRFTGATSARHLLGYDEVGDTLRDWLGWKSPQLKVVYPEIVFRRSIDVGVSAMLKAKLRDQGRWQRK